MLFGVALAGIRAMLGGVVRMRSSGMGMVGRLLMVATFVLLGSFGVVLRGFGVVLSRVLVALCCLLRHGWE